MNQTVNQMMLKGLKAHKEGMLQEAEKFYQSTLEIEPNHPEASHNLGIIKLSTNDLVAALPLFKKAIELNPNIEQFWVSYSNLLIKKNKLTEAEANYRKAITVIPNSSVIHNNLGVVLYKLRRLDEAERYYYKTIELNPNYFQAFNNLCVVLNEMGKLDKAEINCNKAIELKPDYAEAHNNLAGILSEQGKLELAVKSCNKAISFDPELYNTYCTLGIIQKEMGEFDQAIDNFSKAIKIHPNYKDALMSRGQILFDKGKFELSLQDFDNCNSIDSRGRALSALYKLGRIDEIYQRIKTHAVLDAENLNIAAFSSFIFNKEKKDTGHNFCKNPLDFLYFSNISSHLKDSGPFINEVIEELHSVKTRWQPFGRTTVNGFHSGGKVNIFKNPPEKIHKLRSIIIKELELYYSKFKNESCSYIKEWPLKKIINGWHIILKEKGYQKPHMHASGWLSGVIYLKVVPALKKNEGALEFSLNGQYYFDVNSPKVIFQPKLGDIVLFPSSLHHNTIPFTTDADRRVIAFDLGPDRS